MERTREVRLLIEGYAAMRHNPCWRWLLADLARRRMYTRQRLTQAQDWPEHCRLAGQLALIEQLLAQVRTLSEEKEELEHDV